MSYSVYKHEIRNDSESNAMGDEIVPRPARGRQRLLQPGQSGDPAGRRRGSRNKATLGAATLLACGAITPGEAATIAGVYETFVRTAATAKEKVARSNLLQILAAGDDVEDEDEDIGDAEAIDDCDP
jgi:hypothetical protein